MVPTSELDPVGAFFEERFITAYNLFEDDPEAANDIARELLNEPALSNLHRAGMHLLRAHSPEDYVSVLYQLRSDPQHTRLRSLTFRSATTPNVL